MELVLVVLKMVVLVMMKVYATNDNDNYININIIITITTNFAIRMCSNHLPRLYTPLLTIKLLTSLFSIHSMPPMKGLSRMVLATMALTSMVSGCSSKTT